VAVASFMVIGFLANTIRGIQFRRGLTEDIKMIVGAHRTHFPELERIDRQRGIDLSKAKVNNPVSKWFTLSLGQYLALHAAHERRHLWQARQIKEDSSFP
jgi:hypothetical protein